MEFHQGVLVAGEAQCLAQRTEVVVSFEQLVNRVRVMPGSAHEVHGGTRGHAPQGAGLRIAEQRG